MHKGIERITETGIVVGGKEYGPFDCIVWATGELNCPPLRVDLPLWRLLFSILFYPGFETHGAALVNKPDYKLLGRGGLDREDKFKTGWKTMYGVCTHDFPNMFFYGIPQAGATLNWTSLTNSREFWRQILRLAFAPLCLLLSTFPHTKPASRVFFSSHDTCLPQRSTLSPT